MSDFKQAIKWMKEGKKVKRKLWQNSYIFLNKSKGEGDYKIEGDMLTTLELLGYYSFEATDWEIYEKEEEKANLGLATTRELIEEIKTRIEIHWNLDYKTVEDLKW